jgi:hypothetical protein
MGEVIPVLAGAVGQDFDICPLEQVHKQVSYDPIAHEPSPTTSSSTTQDVTPHYLTAWTSDLDARDVDLRMC